MVEAIKIAGTNQSGENIWSCKCSCGLGCLVAESRLGTIKACGEPKGDIRIGVPEPPKVSITNCSEFVKVAATARVLVKFLRFPVPALSEADGFGYAGSVKGAYKHAAKQLDELLQLLENAPKEFADGLGPKTQEKISSII